MPWPWGTGPVAFGAPAQPHLTPAWSPFLLPLSDGGPSTPAADLYRGFLLILHSSRRFTYVNSFKSYSQLLHFKDEKIEALRHSVTALHDLASALVPTPTRDPVPSPFPRCAQLSLLWSSTQFPLLGSLFTLRCSARMPPLQRSLL